MTLHEPLGRVRPRILFAGSWSAVAGQDGPPHHYAAWKVTYYRSGRIDSIVNGIRYPVGPGDALVLPPYAVHEEIAHTAYSNHYLVVDAPADTPWPATFDADTAHDIGWLLAAIVREEPKARDDGSMMPALLEVLDTILRRTDPPSHLSTAETIVRSAERVFEENYAASVSIGDVARQLRVSPSSLRAYFTTLRGIPPQEALQQVRLRHALTLLRTSDLTLASIAERCGFHSPSHLSRHVKGATGSSPGRLRG